MAGGDELVVGKFDPYSDEVAITRDGIVLAHVYGNDGGAVKAMALDFVLGRERAQKAEAENARLQALLAERDAEIARLVAALLDNAESTGADGNPCWCGYDTVYHQHADWCKRARAALAARGGAS